MSFTNIVATMKRGGIQQYGKYDLEETSKLPTLPASYLFALVPRTDESIEAVNRPHNDSYKFRIPSNDNEDDQDNADLCCIGIGYDVQSNASTTIATLGKKASECGIIIDHPLISHRQCSFVYRKDTNAIILIDHTRDSASHITGQGVYEFRTFGANRQVAVLPGIPTLIYFTLQGTEDVLEFELYWQQKDYFQTRDEILNWQKRRRPRLTGADSITGNFNDLGIYSPMMTRLPPRPQDRLSERVRQIGEIGKGSCGVVWMGMDMHDGTLVAVKEINTLKPSPPALDTDQTKERGRAKDEIKASQKFNHPHIMKFLDWYESFNTISIYMPKMRASAKDIVSEKTEGSLDPEAVRTATFQMLSALDHLEQQGFIHRDIKPENILVNTYNRKHTFVLADFGLATERNLSRKGHVGTVRYRPPEAFAASATGFVPADFPTDVWSLLVSLMWMLKCDFRRTMKGKISMPDLHAQVKGAALGCRDTFLDLTGMTHFDPKCRYSARQMLDLFNEESLLPREITDLMPTVNRNARERSASRNNAEKYEAHKGEKRSEPGIGHKSAESSKMTLTERHRPPRANKKQRL